MTLKHKKSCSYPISAGPCDCGAAPESVAVAPQVDLNPGKAHKATDPAACHHQHIRPTVFFTAIDIGDHTGYACEECATEFVIRPEPSSPSVAQEKQPIKESSPVACLAFLPRIVKVAKENGYALTLHGTLARDYDFVAVPWIEAAASPEELVEAIRAACGGLIFDNERDGPTPKPMPHGRLAWKIHLGGGPYIDLSVTPRAAMGASADSDCAIDSGGKASVHICEKSICQTKHELTHPEPTQRAGQDEEGT